MITVIDRLPGRPGVGAGLFGLARYLRRARQRRHVFPRAQTARAKCGYLIALVDNLAIGGNRRDEDGPNNGGRLWVPQKIGGRAPRLTPPPSNRHSITTKTK